MNAKRSNKESRKDAAVENFMLVLKVFKEPDLMEAAKVIIGKYEQAMATNSNLYSNHKEIKRITDDLIGRVNIQIASVHNLVKIESATPHSIFYYLMAEEWSDLMFSDHLLVLSDGVDDRKIEIEEELYPVYQLFLNHLINHVKYKKESKFDTGENILDAELDNFRFNLIHKTVNNNNASHTVVIRKQLVSKIAINDPEKYLAEVCTSEDQRDIINKYAERGNYVIFGEVGSGKTTMLKYMANYGLDQKRNLCVIEDTSELNIDVPISLLTRGVTNIKGLFTAALRQNPSAIVIGETRTSEIIDILEAALTISVGTTIHANSFPRAIQRIIFMSMERQIEPSEIKDLINATIDCFIFMKDRKVEEIWVHGEVITDSIFDAYIRKH